MAERRGRERPASGNAAVGEPLVQLVSATTGGEVLVQNSVFVKGPSFVLQAGNRGGAFTVRNNVFVANKMAAIEIYGTCGQRCRLNTPTSWDQVGVANNTILFSWSRAKDFHDTGYGVRIMTSR